MKVYKPEEFPVPCEVFSRVVGYIRPVRQWNDGKQEEFRQRATFDKSVKAVIRAVKVARAIKE